MAFTFVVSTDVGRVRLLVPDRDATEYVFEDEEIAAFLSLEAGDVRRAAALALETIASDTAMTLKVIRLLELQTDGATTSRALLERATRLRAQADQVEAAAAGGAFDVAEMVLGPFAHRDRLINQALRE